MRKLSSTNSFPTKDVLLPILVVFLASGCQTTVKFAFESLTAPTVLLPADIKTIGFVDRNTNFDIDTTARYYGFGGYTFQDSLNRDSIMARNCYLGFVDNLSEYLAFDTVSWASLPPRHIEGKKSYPPMTWDVVDSLCVATGSDVLVTLEDIQIYNSYSVIAEGNYYGLIDVDYLVVWRIYDPFYQKFIDERAMTDSLFQEVSASSFVQVVESEMPKREEIFTDVSYEIGRQYAELLSPFWNTVSRKYFVGKDSRFAVAWYYIENEDWDSAVSLWEEMTKDDNPKTAARASYNLAFAYELKEDYDIATSWIEKSIGFYEQDKRSFRELNMAKKYAAELQGRFQNYQRLNQFFGE